MKNLYLICWVFLGCQANLKNKPTPTEFLNTSKVPSSKYQTDSIRILERMKGMQKVKQIPFHGDKDGISEPNIIVDTILYSPDLTKMAVMILNKYNGLGVVSNSGREIVVNKINISGYTFICKRTKSDLQFKIMKIQIGSYKSFGSCSKALREIYFDQLSTRQDLGYDYNINDSRFWEGAYFKNME